MCGKTLGFRLFRGGGSTSPKEDLFLNRHVIPCTTDHRARLDELLSRSLPEGTEIHFEAGCYYFDRPIQLDAGHRGLRLTGEPGTRLIGGIALQDWTPVAGMPEAERFSAEAVKHILCCDLNALGVGSLGGFASRGFNRLLEPGHVELFCDQKPLSLSQYPKGQGFLSISGVGDTLKDEWDQHDGVLEQGFFLDDPRVLGWQPSEELCALGYWKYDWASSVERVASIDGETGHVQMQAPYGSYGYRKGERVRFYNIMEELLAPGDYCIDHAKRRIYLYPVPGGREYILSLMTEPLFQLEGAERVELRGLCMEALRGTAVSAYEAKELTVDNCLMRYIGNVAVDLCDSLGARVINSTIHDCGDGAVLVLGGNRLSLEGAGVVIDNNHIHHVAKWSKCCIAAVQLQGVGIRVTHNLIHNCPQCAVMYGGNEITIERNEIYDAVMETGDAGAIYAGRDYSYQGNSVSHNYIHHLGGVGFGAFGIYNDDCLSGTRMRGNYFLGLSRACMLGGGRDLLVDNNVFVKCDPGVSFDSRGASLHPQWIRGCNSTIRPVFYGIRRYCGIRQSTHRNTQLAEKHREPTISAVQEPFASRYPQLQYYHEAYSSQPYGQVRIPAQATVSNNVFCPATRFRFSFDTNSSRLREGDELVPLTRRLKAYVLDPTRDINQTIASGLGELTTRGNFSAQPSDFVDAGWGDLRLKPESDAFHYGYVAGDFEHIGLKEDERLLNPPRVMSRLTMQGLSLRNLSDRPVAGSMRFYPGEGVQVSAEAIAFELEPGAEAFYPLDIAVEAEEPMLTARGDLPGLRPCRL